MTDKNLSLVVDFKGIDGLSNTLRVITGAGNQAEAEIRDLTKTLANQRNELKNYDKLLKNVSKIDGPVDHLYRRQKELKEQVEKTTAELRKQSRFFNEMNNAKALGGEMRVAGMGNIGTGLAIGAPPTLMAREAAKFETSMAGAKKVLNGWNADALKDLNKDVLDLSGNIPIAAEGLASIVAAGGQDGVGQEFADKGNFKAARAELIGFATDAAKMAVAFDISAEDAGARMSAWRASMGITQIEAAKLADQINALSDSKGGGNAADISEITTKIGGLAKIGGVGRQEVAAMASHLSGMKVPVDVASTGIKNMMLALVSGSEASKGQVAAFSKLGLDSNNIAKNMQIDAKGTILDVFTRISSLSKDQQASTTEAIFGREGLLAIAPMISQLDNLKTKFDFVGNSANFAGSMTREFNSRNETAEAQALMAKNELRALAIDMGATLLPAIKSGSKSIKEITHNARAWAEQNPELAKGLMKGAVILSGLVIGVGALRIAIGAGLETFSNLRVGIGFLGRGFQFARLAITPLLPVLGAISWPIWAAIGVITLLGAAWATNFLGIRDKTKSAIDFIKSINLIETGKNLIGGFINGIISKIPFLNVVMGKVANAAKKGIDKPLDVNSPSRWAVSRGKFFVEGFGIGIDKNSHLAFDAAKGLSKKIMAAGAIAAAGGGTVIAAPAHSASMNFTININGAGGNAQEIADLVKKEIEKIVRGANTKLRADYGDYS